MVCAPEIDRHLDEWVAMGGGNSGCCGDKSHIYGFHCRGNQVPTSDYSRRYDPGRPYNMDWCCAGDFAHNFNPGLMAIHAQILTRCLRGELPTLWEFIGKPFPDQPVLYFFRPNGLKVKRYTGKGHDRWSHFGFQRSRAHEPFNLWASTVPVVYKPPAPGKLAVDGELGRNTIKAMQRRFGTPVDGVISRDSMMVRQLQAYLNSRLNAGLTIDGDGLWQNNRFSWTITALQQWLGTPMDGRLSAPKSMAVQELQRRLNAGTF